jgi:hypothetical protein
MYIPNGMQTDPIISAVIDDMAILLHTNTSKITIVMNSNTVATKVANLEPVSFICSDFNRVIFCCD